MSLTKRLKASILIRAPRRGFNFSDLLAKEASSNNSIFSNSNFSARAYMPNRSRLEIWLAML